jgi:hypothetical protein
MFTTITNYAKTALYCFIIVSIFIIETLFEIAYTILYISGFIIYCTVKITIDIIDIIQKYNLFTELNLYLTIIVLLFLTIIYWLYENNGNKENNRNTKLPIIIIPPVSNQIIIDLTGEDNDDEKSDEKSDENEQNEDDEKPSDTSDETDVYLDKNKVITDDDYNQLLFDSSIHIWKKYSNTKTTNKWYFKKNEADVKYIISQLLPIDIKIANDLFIKYKGMSLDKVPPNKYEDVWMARELRPSIYNVINEVYNKIKNSYKYGVDGELIM